MLGSATRQLFLDFFGVSQKSESAKKNNDIDLHETNHAPVAQNKTSRANEHRNIHISSTHHLSGRVELDVHQRRIASYLSIILPEPIDVVLTNNRSTMISYKKQMGRLAVRLHKMFRYADGVVLDSLAMFIAKGDKTASGKINEFIARYKNEIKTSANKTQKKSIIAVGEHQNLKLVLADVDKRYFDQLSQVQIGWGRARHRRHISAKTRTISRALATYSYHDRTIRVNPVLDCAKVPKYFLEWIVYHELLHHVLPVEEKLGKKQYHTPKFRALERAFDKYEEARNWEQNNLAWLLK